MKSLLFLFFSICILSACTKRNDTLIKGEVKGLHQSEVIFYGFRPDSNESVKIVPIEQEAFTCTLIPDSIWPVLVVLDGKLELPIFAQKGDEILIKGDVNDPSSLIVEGGNSINEELNTWRQKKSGPEDFIKDHPDSPASAWIILNEALSKETMDKAHLQKLLGLVTPRIAESQMLSPLKKELERSFSKELEIPFFSKEARAILRDGNEKIDSVFTQEKLSQRINSLINR